MGVSVGGRERPLGLFEVLTRNRQSALEQRSSTRSAREQPPRMCTIPPRQRLPFTRWLAIRTRRFTRDRIRIRRITSCNNTFRERALSLNYSTFFTSFSNTNERNIENVHPSRALVLRERGYRPDDCICDEARAMGRSRGFYRVLDDWYVIIV